ncbi:MAG: hypothetical protein FIA92_01515 [Chloroflexi bacterium]|nr:hypothetical protein [Chloroflexota bacterium]
MPENPTYRVTGDDWDPPDRRQLPGDAALDGSGAQDLAEAEPPTPTLERWVAPSAAAREVAAGPGSGWAVPAAATARMGASVAAPGFAAVTADGVAVGAESRRRSPLAGLSDRLPPPFRAAIERVPPRFLLGGAGLVVVAVAFVVLVSGRPSGVAATETPAPTEVAAVATPGCSTPAAPLPIPDLLVTAPGAEARALTGFAGPAEVDLDGPWPAELGAVEASVPLGSTIRLTSTGACIAEWRAVAARPPSTIGKAWRPKGPETVELGWQRADRIAWQPAVPLPPRGEWIVRLTVWYREGDEPGAPSQVPGASPNESADGLPEGLVVERYFRLVVEAPAS